ncbi:MAG: class A beta-lactamase [Muribaculaceae bacterium]|nr:class A beta-lactamase [Muribaculaceae bacterium]MDE6754110.1 class A beta-lactamase [Muribaculaceae bacterium]
METLLKTYIDDKDARIGIGLIINGKDTIEVNGKEEFPMMSVFKFPLALVVAHIIDSKGMELGASIKISEEDLKENTWSPMVLKYGRKPMVLSVRELLEWSLKESDNNAADILLDYIGGIEGMNFNMRQMNLPKEIKIGATEDDMHRNPSLCYLNMSTPIAIAELLNYFNLKLRDSSDSFREVALMMENCKTGTDRLAAPFISSGAVLGHKTGTGDKQESGRISAINDCGYVNLPDSNFYSIAVFIADSGYDIADTSAMIAEISRIVYQEVCKEK